MKDSLAVSRDGGDVKVGSSELMLQCAGYLLQAHSEFSVASALLFCSDEHEDAHGFDLRPGSAGGIEDFLSRLK